MMLRLLRAFDQSAVKLKSTKMREFHEACAQGDLEKLGKNLQLFSPTFVESSDTVVQQLLSVCYVRLAVASDNTRKRRCRGLRGSAAEIAVMNGHIKCANLVLSVLLYRTMVLTPWNRKFRTCSKLIFARKVDVLRDVLAFLGSKEWVHLRNLCQQTWECDMEVLYALLAASLLGLADVVRAILKLVGQEYFDRIDQEMKQKNLVNMEAPMFSRDLTATVAALGGDLKCLQLIFEAFSNNFTPFTLQEVWLCLLNPLWLWTVPQMPKCLNFMDKSPLFNGVKTMSRDFDKFLLLFTHVRDWLTKRDAVAAKYQALGRTLPSEHQVICALQKAVPKAVSMIHPECLKKLDSSSLFMKAISNTKECYGPHSAVSQVLENLLICILTQKDLPNCLMGRDVAQTLSELDEERQQVFLATLGQYKVLIEKEPPVELLTKGCILCHPLVSLLSGVRKPYLHVLSELNLWTLLPYFGPKELHLVEGIMKKPRSSLLLCDVHSVERRRGRYPLLTCMKKKAPMVLHHMNEVRTGISLRHLCLLTILKNINEDPNHLEKLQMPGFLRSYFLLKGFLDKLTSQPRA